MTSQSDFREAVENNEYAEYDLNSTFTLITDVDSSPYIVADKHDSIETALEAVDTVLSDNSDFVTVEYVEYDEQNSSDNLDVFHLTGVYFE